MKRLILLRHAKAVPKGEATDAARVLASEGRREMEPVARFLGGDGLRPDLALVSPACRTRETWDLAKAAFPDVPVAFDERIYEAASADLLGLVRDPEPVAATVILVGHNPGIEELAQLLAGSGNDDVAAGVRGGMPTASVAVLDFDVAAWGAIGPGRGRLAAFVTPASLGCTRADPSDTPR